MALGTKCLRQIALGQNDDGALPAEYPADSVVYPTRQFVPFGIPTFMAQWVSMLLDHHRYTGDLKFVSELYPNVVRVMAYLDRFLDSDGLLSSVRGFVFLDWVPLLMDLAMGGQGQLTGMNCHYHRALLDAAEISGLLGDRNQQGDWLERAEKVTRPATVCSIHAREDSIRFEPSLLQGGRQL